MKTDELQIVSSPKETEIILDKIELIALYTGMSRRDASSMRLLAEEMLSAVKDITEIYRGSLWMDTGDDAFVLHMKVAKPLDKAERDKLISLSKTGDITPPRGLFSRLGATLGKLLLVDSSEVDSRFLIDYACLSEGAYSVSLMYNMYPYQPTAGDDVSAKPAEKEDELAGIEKSIIDAIVDDIVVTMHNNYVEITALKKLK